MSNLRIAIKCSWSGARFTIPSSSSSSSLLTLKPKTTLLEIMESIRTSLPDSIFETGELLYIRTCIKSSEWKKTTLKSLGIKMDDAAGILFTLNQGFAASIPTPPPPPAATTTTTTTTTQPMEIDTPPTTSTEMTPSQALELLLSSNFDADSKECIVTLCKLVDNIVSKPGNEKVRTIRLTNEAFEKKVARKSGGVEFLLACGFTYQPVITPALSPTPPKPEFIELLPQNESTSTLLSARKLLATKATTTLQMKSTELPNMKNPPPPPPPLASSRGGGAASSSSFDPYKTHSYNTQSAAAGAPNPHTIGNTDTTTLTKTEKKLNALKSKQQRLEQKMQIVNDRGLIAMKPGETIVTTSTATTTVEDGGGGGGGGGKSDGALLAARMKRMEEERKKREEGGFTTKAMRDLEKMKNKKVYSHTLLRINFSDGCSLHSKFLPNESISTVKQVITSAFCSDFQSVLKFDLYVAPPRRMLDEKKRLDEEGLVPAAKVHVSWKVNGAPPPPSSSSSGVVGSYLKSELFQSASVATASSTSSSSAAVSYPDAKKVVEDEAKAAKKRAAGDAASASSGDAKVSREEAMMQRMLGMKPKGLLGKSSKKKMDGGSSGSKSGGGGKPKWFKG